MEIEDIVVTNPSMDTESDASPWGFYRVKASSRKHSVVASDCASSHNSRHSGRISCRSSVRDEAQTSDELARKQRVVRCMQIERERAARSKLERAEHDDWLRLRSTERAEVVKHMTDEQIVELLRREAKEIERERLETEEAIRRGTEEAATHRRLRARQGISNRSNGKVYQQSRRTSLRHDEAGGNLVEGTAEVKGTVESLTGIKSEAVQLQASQVEVQEPVGDPLTATSGESPHGVKFSTDTKLTSGDNNAFKRSVGQIESNRTDETNNMSTPISPDSLPLSPSPVKDQSDPLTEARAMLHRSQEEVLSLQTELKDVKQVQRLMEAKVRAEEERADNEAKAKLMFAKRADAYKADVEQLQKKVAVVQEELHALKRTRQTDSRAQELVVELKAAKEQVKCLEEENRDLRDKYQRLQDENVNLSRDLSRRVHGALQDEAALELDTSGRSGLADANVYKSESGKGERGKEVVGNLVEKYNKLVDQLKELQRKSGEQQLELQRVTSENADLRKRYQVQSAAESKRQSVAEKHVKSDGASVDQKELEKLRREVKNSRSEANEARKELRALKESSDNEIASLKEWCERLKVRCKQQTEDLKKYISQCKSVPPAEAEVKGKEPAVGSTEGGANTINTARVMELQQLRDENSQLQSRLSEILKKEQAALSLVESLKKEKNSVINRERNKEEEFQKRVDALNKALSEGREAEARLKESKLATEKKLEDILTELVESRRATEELERKVGLLREEQKVSVALRQEQASECTELHLTVTNIRGENEELRQRIVELEKQLRELRQKYLDLEREAEESSAKARMEIEELKRKNEILSQPPQSKANGKRCC